MNAAATRRGLLAAAPALAAIAVNPPIAAGAAPALPVADARLVRLSAALLASWAECDAIDAPYYDVLGGNPNAEEMARRDEPVDRNWRLRALIARLPARTPVGLRAKVHALLCHLGEPYQLECVGDRIARSLCHDVLALAEGA